MTPRRPLKHFLHAACALLLIAAGAAAQSSSAPSRTPTHRRAPSSQPCPTHRPRDNARCSDTTANCFYPDNAPHYQCTCMILDGPDPQWNCQGLAGAE